MPYYVTTKPTGNNIADPLVDAGGTRPIVKAGPFRLRREAAALLNMDATGYAEGAKGYPDCIILNATDLKLLGVTPPPFPEPVRLPARKWLKNFAATPKDGRPLLCNAHVVNINDTRYVMAANGHSLAMVPAPDLDLGAYPLKETKLVGEPEHQNTDGMVDYASLEVKRNPAQRITIDTYSLHNALRRARVFAKHENNCVVLSFGRDSKLTITARAKDIGDSSAVLHYKTADYGQSEFSIAVNCTYLMYALYGDRPGMKTFKPHYPETYLEFETHQEPIVVRCGEYDADPVKPNLVLDAPIVIVMPMTPLGQRNARLAPYPLTTVDKPCVNTHRPYTALPWADYCAVCWTKLRERGWTNVHPEIYCESHSKG